MAKVKIYTTPTCQWCKKAKEFFKANNIEYEEINIAEDQKAREEMVEKSGQNGVPVIEVNGQILVGSEIEPIKKALKL